MSQRYIWKGPPTSVDIWSEPHGPEVELIWSGQLAPDAEIPIDLPPTHGTIAGWLAFKLIEKKPETPAPATPRARKENADG